MPPLGHADLHDDREKIARLEVQVQSLRERMTWMEQSYEARMTSIEKSVVTAVKVLEDLVTEKLRTLTSELRPFKWLNYLLAGTLIAWALSSMLTPTPRPGSPPPISAPRGP